MWSGVLALFLCSFIAADHLDEFVVNHPKILPQQAKFADFEKDKFVRFNHARKEYVTKERLPEGLKAIHYELTFQPYFPSDGVTYSADKNFTFDATAVVTVEATSNGLTGFTLNAYNLTLNQWSVVSYDGVNVPIDSLTTKVEIQQITLNTKDGLIQQGAKYNISFTYTGFINYYEVGGLFYTYYTAPSGQRTWMIATHMEPFYARLVFPSLDEPGYKATFQVSLTHPTSLVALNNMMEPTPVDIGNGWSRSVFGVTPKMSTYLVAFAVGPYVSESVTNKAGLLVRSWGWTGTEEHLKFAAENSAACLYELAKYTNISFPLDKADQLGLPEFPAGAMENWGLIIYKYQYIVYNAQTMTTADKEAAAKVMCHELAHQWFGDLVTTAWWDDLFLNEGFADYFMRYTQKAVYPEQTDYFDALHVREELQAALEADISDDAHPVVAPDGPHFDYITYRKGSSILRLISDVIGESTFQSGLQNYLNDRKYDSATHEQLFYWLTDANNKNGAVTDWCGRVLNVSDFLGPYVHQINYPLIKIANNIPNEGFELGVEPYKNTSSLPDSQYNYNWAVPLRYQVYYNDDVSLVWVVSDGIVCNADNKVKKRINQYVVGGITTAVYGRLLYDDIGFDRLIKKIAESDVPNSVKVTLLSDEVTFLNKKIDDGSQFSYDRILTLAKTVFNTNNFTESPSWSPYDIVAPLLENLSSILRLTVDEPLIKRLYDVLFYEAYEKNTEKLGWLDSGSWDVDSFKEAFLPTAVKLGFSKAEALSLKFFDEIKTACRTSINGTAWCNPVTPNIRRAVYCGVAKYSGQSSDNFFQLFGFYNAEVITNPYFYQEYMALLEGLTCSESPGTLKIVIRTLLQSSLDAATVFGWLKTNPAASDQLYNYILQNSDAVLSVSDERFDAYLDAMSYNWNDEANHDRFKLLSSDLKLSQSQGVIHEKYSERIKSNKNFYEKYGPLLISWIYDNAVTIGKTPWTVRADGNVIPQTYDVTLQPYIPGSSVYEWHQNLTFTGTVKIAIKIQNATDTIQLNAHRLIINDVVLTDDAANKINVNAVTKDFVNGFLYIKANDTLPQGNYELKIQFTGFIFNHARDGITINWNVYEFNGNKGFIFTTDFEGGPGLRSLFPCIDEPSYKADFSLTLRHPSDMIALHNTAEYGIQYLKGGWAETSFVPTPIMSTYLFAISVGHFASISKVSETDVVVRYWSWAGMEIYGDFGLNITAGTVDFMATYFGKPFPLPKLDTIALPQYSNAGSAMENFGLIIGNYEAFLIDPMYATTAQYAEVAEVAAHETVHQWFGDLVTLDWWDDIFLNEGFAQYWFANGINHTIPEQSGYVIDYNRYLVNKIALEIDCYSGTAKPVVSSTPPVFSSEAYYKGSALLNLLENTIGTTALQYGLIQYINDLEYKNANPIDLWEHLTEGTQLEYVLDWNNRILNVSHIMIPYTTQTSFPILTVTQTGDQRSYTQESCLLAESGLTWNIPVFSTSEDGEQFSWFTGTNGSSANWTTTGKGFKLDNSFLRVLYDENSWKQILNAINLDNQFADPTTRAMLLDDTYFFVESGRLNWTRWLDLSKILVTEFDYIPWSSAYKVLKNLLARYQFHPDRIYVERYVVTMVRDVFNKYGILSDDYTLWTELSLSAKVSELACKAGYSDCVSRAQGMFIEFIDNCGNGNSGTGACNNIIPDHRRTVYCYGIRQDEDMRTYLHTFYDYFQVQAIYFDRDADNILHALGCLTTESMKQEYIESVLYEVYPAKLLQYIAENDDQGNVLYNFFYNNAEEIVFGSVDFASYVNAMITGWYSETHLQYLTDIQSLAVYQHMPLYQKSALNATIAEVKSKNLWMSTYSDTIISWIKANYPDD